MLGKVARCNALHNLGQHWETLSQVGAASTSNNLLTRGSKAKGCFLRIGHLDNPSMTDRSKEENWSFASLHLINWDPISRLYKLPITYIIGTASFVQRLLHIGIQKYFCAQKSFYLHVGIMRIRMIRTRCSGLDLDLMLVLESASCGMS